jgi:hypothetical protein
MTYPRAIVYAAPWVASAVIGIWVGPASGIAVAFFAMMQNATLSEDKA